MKIKKYLPRLKTWKEMNTPTYTPIGLIGWMSFIASGYEDGLIRLVCQTIVAFAVFMWMWRQNNKIDK